MDQAQHFGALGNHGGGAGDGQKGEDFREGLDGTERERERVLPISSEVRIHGVVQYSPWPKPMPNGRSSGTKVATRVVADINLFHLEQHLPRHVTVYAHNKISNVATHCIFSFVVASLCSLVSMSFFSCVSTTANSLTNLTEKIILLFKKKRKEYARHTILRSPISRVQCQSTQKCVCFPTSTTATPGIYQAKRRMQHPG